jgi:hypothetical protein
MEQIKPDTTLAELYVQTGLNVPLIVDLYPVFTHIDIHSQFPREDVFVEDEDPNIYGASVDALHSFRNRILAFQTIRFLQIIGPADVMLYLPNNSKANIERALAAIPAQQRAKPQYIDLDGQDVQECIKVLVAGKKLIYWRPKGWMLSCDCVVDPSVAYVVNDKRYLFHPGIPTPEMEMIALDNADQRQMLARRPLPFVVKLCRCSLAQGTYLVGADDERQHMLACIQRYHERGGKEVQLSEYIPSDKPHYGVHFFVGLQNREAPTFLGATEQVFSQTGTWIGGIIDYGSQGDLEQNLRDTINAVANSLPESYIGWVDVDVIFDKTGKPLVVDLNARMAGGMGLVLFSKHFLQHDLPFALFDTVRFGKPAKIVYEILSSELKSGQIIVTLAAEISDTESMASLIIGGRSRADLLAVQQHVHGALALRTN